MTTRIEKTVFISYRRTNLPWALAIYQNLTHYGYDVFFDYDSIKSGDFEQAIIQNIRGRAHFVLILTPSALERCSESGDWLRREIELAIDEKRNIVPLMLEGFNFSSPSVTKQLTGKLTLLKKYNGLNVPADYFEAAMTRLRNDRLNISLDTVLHPISDAAKKLSDEQQLSASSAAQIQKIELASQEVSIWGKKIKELNSNSEEIKRVAFTANSGWAILFGWNGCHYGNIPDGTSDSLNELNKSSKEIKHIAFTADGGWVILFGRNGFRSSNIPKGALDSLNELNEASKEIKHIAFTANDGWVILFGRNGYHSSNIPKGASDSLNELNKASKEIKQIAFTANGGWVILYGGNGYHSSNIPKGALDRLRELNKANKEIKLITFSLNGSWVIINDKNDYWFLDTSQ